MLRHHLGIFTGCALIAACGGGAGTPESTVATPATVASATPAAPTPTGSSSGSTSTATSDTTSTPTAALSTTTACDFPHDAIVDVADATALALALSQAAPGTLIRLAPGTYAGRFVASRDGTASQPIVVCGARDAILDAGALDTGYVFHVTGASRWILSGFTLQHGKNGIVLDGADHVRMTGLLVQHIGQEAVHFRSATTDSVIDNSEIRDTGLYVPGVGEGVYVGSAISHWVDSSTPDRSDRNQVLDNRIGPDVRAESIDIKEGTSGGVVRGNVFDGRGISGENSADSWMDVKGNGYLIEQNTGTDAPLDGFQVHERVAGWGNDNVFANNVATVNGPGYGFSIDAASTGNVVRCDNQASGAALGLSNVACVAASVVGGIVDAVLNPLLPPSGNFDLSHWKITIPAGTDIQTDELNLGYTLANAFYTDRATGGMVFECPNLAGTTANTHYSRTELREMLSPGSSAGADENNWTTSDGGTLTATLRIDHVSTTGDDAKVGRVVIGQIHGPDSEPIRLYFHKKPGEAKGRLYAGHDDVDDNGTFSRDIVPNTDGAGIALGETFSYTIRLVDIHLTVTIQPAAGPAYRYAYDIDPRYRGLNLYFKAGVYNQNNTGTSDDYVQATFFTLAHTHP